MVDEPSASVILGKLSGLLR